MSKKVTVRTEEWGRVHIPLEEAGVKDLGLKCDTCGGRDAPFWVLTLGYYEWHFCSLTCLRNHIIVRRSE